jgi:indole-3-glycerol phosphate synthase
VAADILARIVDHKRREVEASAARVPLAELERLVAAAPPPRGFAAALRSAAGHGIGLIAEVKQASPSAGLMRADFDPVAIARTYAAHGATCLSVLTDAEFFRGSLDDLRAVRAAVDLPVLRKDFVIDAYQVFEARAAGADCVLLIAECLDHCRLRELDLLAHDLGMDVLIEVHDEENLDRALDLEPELLGINNRDLKAMRTDLGHTLRLAERVPASVLLVSESGIRTAEDVHRLRACGVRAILVGESLMKSPDIGAAVDALLARGGP